MAGGVPASVDMLQHGHSQCVAVEAFPLCELRQSHYRIVLVHFVIAGGRVVSAMENHPLVRAGLTSMREMHNFGL